MNDVDDRAPKPPLKTPPQAPGRKFWLVLLVIWGVLIAFQFFGERVFPVKELSYSEFKAYVREGRIQEVNIGAQVITGVIAPQTLEAKSDEPLVEGEPAKSDQGQEAAKEQGKDGEKKEEPKGEAFKTVRVDDEDLVRDLEERSVKITGIQDTGGMAQWLPTLLLLAAFIGLPLLIMRRMRDTQGGFMTVGKSKAKVYVEKDVGVTFKDVAGVDEAKEELQEVIEFLKTPEKFGRLGGKMPKGILLVGPPGTGKTLLARAVAGEAGVPFFSISGSDFVEMFVGVGAARVRDLFNQAKSKAPCIIFIDELDAIGKARGVGPMAHEEREQTLNQLLVELDGFDSRVGVIIMAASNRPEILDQALLRAGRFDRHILVDRPDKVGRLAILKVHAKNVSLDPEVDLEEVARVTPGFAGADLANLINEAALLAVRRGKDSVGRAELQEAVERVIAGLEKKNRVLNPKEKERVAYHEIGHALAALELPGADPVHKISIIPRGISALGYTLQVPTEDRYLMTKSELETKVAVLLGGRVAEELVFDEVSTGASDDLKKATNIARSMVIQYGMSEKIGKLGLETDSGPQFLREQRSYRSAEYSEETAREIDCEVRRIVEEQYVRTKDLLTGRLDSLKQAAKVLLEKECIQGEELAALVGRPLKR